LVHAVFNCRKGYLLLGETLRGVFLLAALEYVNGRESGWTEEDGRAVQRILKMIEEAKQAKHKRSKENPR
jgi:hypothetical protein